tara:strand:+ start:769 stop:2058 length:1290 start_codon:yes stop_codon:yes gene_type:complete
MQIFYLIFLASLIANFNVENAFPNLSFQDPVGIHAPNDGTNRLFVVEQEGRIKVFNNDTNTSDWDMFLDITNLVDQDGGYTEEGLLGLAFHPNFTDNGYFYVNYTEHNPRRNVIARYTVNSNNPNQANYNSSQIILEVGQPYTNHNGGQMEFGPNDGYLYISFGDGGSAGDPLGHGQNTTTLLGTLIRIDVDNPSNGLNYSIPSDNPFVDVIGPRPEIYAYGLRNMWRFSFDLQTGFLWGADVGQYEYEEINIIESGGNYGWNIMEGTSCYDSPSCNEDGLELPIWEYELYVNGVCSITGGYVYRGPTLWNLTGKYIYGDWCTGDIWALEYSEDGNHVNEHLMVSGINITSFGVDQYNELLICANSNIYKLTSSLGDINSDGDLNVLDIVSLVNIILSNDYSDTADLNSDDTINILDVVLLVNAILGSN